MPTLLSVSIGPVQDFIAASRKMRDLWFGSMLLSKASRAAAGAFPREALIFPAPVLMEQEHEDLAVANKLLVELPDGSDAGALAEAARVAALAVLERFWQAVFATIGASNVVQTRVDGQIADFLEFAAAWLPYTDGHQIGSSARAD